MRRTTIALTMVSVTALALTGCSSDSGSTGKPKVTFIQGVSNDPFYQSMACGAKAEAAKIGVDLNVQGANNWDVSLQTPIVQSAIAAKPRVLFIAPNDATGMVAPLRTAKAAGIKVATVDTTIKDTGLLSYRIATDNVAAGAAAADALAKLIGEKGDVLLVGEQPGVTTAVQRAQGFRDQLKKYPNITYVGNVFTNTGGVSGISALVSSKIAATPNLAGVFALATDQSQGTNNAVRAAGKSGAIKVIGFDAGATQVDQLKQGVVQALVAQMPTEIGRLAVQQAKAIVDGKKPAEVTGTGTTIITADNVGNPETAKYLYSSTC
ncbi:ABC transporter substrate-binding protein [Williamsia sp. CHRR-6]|uniref:ABC transporter substrate-binding protein n=1 Tax=Williamsia sp. CHRR-6 TaxID=2835871 RepID=UPI001BDA31D1|nr:ABC transporter substrate-binding protein [Williamsia sp. CHRR-6]MBT0566400.1 substrate-binding domain-containing protein [Williamsia sp. CHRR-6]